MGSSGCLRTGKSLMETPLLTFIGAGNPAKPQRKYREMMLDRMNESHSAVTEWGLSYAYHNL